ncbi:unnamed protein product [Urochloa humidicola]
MGAFASRSATGHSHRAKDHRAHLERVDSNDDASSAAPACAMCQLRVNVGAAAYRCPEQGCTFLLHDACYRRPRKLKAHAGHHEHRLTLCNAADKAGNPSCSICAQGFGALSFAYRCAAPECAAAAGGFLAHPRCCDLPQELIAGHGHGRLVLRRPASLSGGDGDGPCPRRCMKKGHRQSTATAGQQAAAWSYQCPTPTCDKEVCLACLLHGNAADTVEQRCCGGRCCDAVTPGAVHCLGQVGGVLLCGFVTGMGCPGSAPPKTWTVPGVNE